MTHPNTQVYNSVNDVGDFGGTFMINVKEPQKAIKMV